MYLQILTEHTAKLEDPNPQIYRKMKDWSKVEGSDTEEEGSSKNTSSKSRKRPFRGSNKKWPRN